MAYDVPFIIDGRKETDAPRKLEIYNPATGAVIGQVGVADQQVVDRAVTAALKAFETWSSVPPPARAKIMFKFKNLLEANMDDLAKIVSQEHGKTFNEAIGSIQRGIDVVDFTTNIPYYLKGSFAEGVANSVDSYSVMQPLGVCAGITPFNFPAMIPLWMFPMAIACGNTFILKPSEKDPSCAVRLVELAKEAGVPDGVINLVHGDKETVDAILNHPKIAAISFVGSSPIAEYVYKTAASQHKRVQAFGGAKNHCVVMPDADLDVTADALISSAFNCAGERCMAISVVVCIGDKVADELVKRLVPRIEKLKIGPGLDDKIDMGPLVTKQHWEKVQHYIEEGKKEGAKAVLDGSAYKPKDFENGFFMGCTLFDNVKPEMRIYKEEIFGPVLSIMRVPDFATALQLANDHEFGNGVSIYTRDGYMAREFAEKVQAGMVGINIPVPVPVAYHSFGGWKRSIFSDIGMYGTEGVRFYTKLKTVTTRWYPGELP
jgi:malonate-semialdehyde dehydrogenase (acetylating) / methylmalonate-semialdehyde dehydrogenase